jgi:hypothetical protein
MRTIDAGSGTVVGGVPPQSGEMKFGPFGGNGPPLKLISILDEQLPGPAWACIAKSDVWKVAAVVFRNSNVIDSWNSNPFATGGGTETAPTHVPGKLLRSVMLLLVVNAVPMLAAKMSGAVVYPSKPKEVNDRLPYGAAFEPCSPWFMIVMKKLEAFAPVPCALEMPKQNENKDPPQTSFDGFAMLY